MANLRVDKRLFDFIQSVRKIADIRGVAPGNPVVLRVTIPISAHLVIVVCAMEEPTTAILPLNALWLNLNGSSGNYLRLMQRMEKNTGVNGYTHKWMNVDTFGVLDIIQEYDTEDKERLQASINVGTASSNRLGLVRLSVQPLSSSNPVAVGANDPRLSNSRTPLPHTHPMPPVTQIKTSTGIITIDQSVVPEEGMVLFATSPTSVTWKHLVHSDISNVSEG